MKKLKMLGVALLLSSFCFAESPEPAAGEADIAREKARKYAAEKNWEPARVEAEKATTLRPNDADSWLILGTVEQRLEHPDKALIAFKKYLSLNPPEDKANAVKPRIAELEIAAEKYTKAKTDEKASKFGGGGSGVVIGFSPVFTTAMRNADDLASTIGSSLFVAYRQNDSFDIGLKYGSGTVPALTITDATTSVATPYTNSPHKYYELFMQFNFPLNKPFTKLDGFQFLVPIDFGVFMNRISASASQAPFNVGGVLGTGILVRYYTGTFLVINTGVTYRFGVPFANINTSPGAGDTVNGLGNSVKGNPTGLEWHISLAFIL